MTAHDKNGFTPLMVAVKHRRLKSVQKLLASEFCTKEVLEMVSQDDSERTVLHICAEVNQNEIIKVLFEKIAELYNDNQPWAMCDVMGNTPLHICAQKGNSDMCEKIIEYYKRNSSDSTNQSSRRSTILTMKNYNKWTAFHEAVQNGYFGIVDSMRKNLDDAVFKDMAAIVDEELRTSLHMAAEKG
ncbi:unnamed protein product [Rotaria sp. Silwood1]|nr:unnamed protein product [Rotaria sp. Silwood1]